MSGEVRRASGRRDLSLPTCRAPVPRHGKAPVIVGPVLAHGGGGSAGVPLPGPSWLLLTIAAALAVAGVLRTRRPSPAGGASLLTTGAARLGRGLLVAGTSFGMSLSGHVLAGTPPALSAELLAAGGVLTVGCCAASRVRWTFLRLLAVTATAEPAFHVLFETSGSAGTAPVSAAAAVVGLLTDPVMLLAHAAAAVALAAVLAHGEALAFDLAALLAAAVVRWIAPVGSGAALPRPARHRSSDVRPAPRPASVLLVSSPRRGPPQGVRVG